MAYSYIIINFERVPEPDEVLYTIEETYGINILEKFRMQRLASEQTRIPRFAPSPDRYLGFISENYKDAVNLDANATNLFTVEWTNGAINSGIGTVKITANYPNAVFVVDFNDCGAVTTIQNDSVPPFNISEIIFEETEFNKCQFVKVSVETSVLATEIIQPIASFGNSQNPFKFDYMRGQTFVFEAKDVNGNLVSTNITTPDNLISSNFNLTINNSPNGSTVIVNNSNTNGLNLEYSLDNSTWQSSNVFSGLDSDSFTLYIRDQFGCSTSIDFTVSDVGIYTPFFYISKSNSIRFAQRINFGDAANYKNDENTLSCEVLDLLPYKEIQLFQTSDIVPTQFKSNFANNLAEVIKSDGTTVNVPVIKKSQNIGAKDKRDAIKYSYNGKTAIYFLSGNTYDYDSGVVNGSYSLNGSLPYWANIAGNYVSVGTSFFLIQRTMFDEEKGAEVIIIDEIYTGMPVSVIVGSIFNYQPYEVYEFEIDMLDYINSDIRVRVVASDPNFTTITYLSELINVKVRQENTLEIKYWNSTNTDIFYETGIRFLIRQEFIDIIAVSVEEFENNKTDTTVVLMDADIYEADQFDFEPVTKEMFRKIVRALGHETVYINNVGYVKNDAVDFEKQGVSNLYTIKAKMIKTGGVYNSQSSGISEGIYSGDNLEIPGLVDYNGGFVKYKI